MDLELINVVFGGIKLSYACFRGIYIGNSHLVTSGQLLYGDGMYGNKVAYRTIP